MKVYDDGVYRDMTVSEVAEYERIVNERTPKAKTKINKGELFNIDGDDYVALATIPAGDFLHIGTNCKLANN